LGEVRVPKALRQRDPVLLAPLAGLAVVDDSEPGVRRVRCGRGFRYVGLDGETIRVPEKGRLVELAVPPAWESVWLSPIETGYLQATGRDAADRKQYRYHDAYRELRDRQKFDRLRYFPRALKQLRAASQLWLSAEPGSQPYAVGAVLRLIDVGLIRMGNDASAQNHHHGATTLQADHLDVEPDEDYVELRYTSKGGKERIVVIEDDQLVEVLQSLADPDTERLFWYHDAQGEQVQVTPTEVNRSITELVGPAFTAKDFRTWGGSRAALVARAEGASEIEAVDAAATMLGNTRAVARSSYVHPTVLSSAGPDLERLWHSSRSSASMSRGDSALSKVLRQAAPLLGPLE